MKGLIVLMFLFLIAINSFALKINEFIVTPTGSEAVELYNETGSPVDLTNYILTVITTVTNNATFKSYSLLADSYHSFQLGTTEFVESIGLANDGAIIKLYDASNNLLDSMGYGSYGSAPAPIYNFSCARVADTGDNATDFNMDWTPSMGAINSLTAPGLGTGNVFINEVFPSDSSDSDTTVVEFIELYNNSNIAIDVGNWVIVCDDDYYVTAATNIPAYGYYVLYDTSFPTYFKLDSRRDNIYLYTGTGERVDQVGWNELTEGLSFSVRPNGVRTVYDGYNVASSPDFELYTPTPDAINPVDEVYTSRESDCNIIISSLSNIGISIENPTNITGTMQILDTNGRVLYSTFIKNLVFDTNAGTYFVKTFINGITTTTKVNVIK